jgi:hypothetical protein
MVADRRQFGVAVQRFADNILAHDAEHLLERLVHERDATFGVAQDHGQRQGLEQCAQHAQGVRQRALELFALGDVGIRARHARDAAFRIAAAGGARGLYPHPSTVRMAHAVLNLEQGCGATDCVGDRGTEDLQVVGRHQRRELGDGHQLVVAVDSQKTKIVSIEENVAGGEVPFPQGQVRRVECNLQALITRGLCFACVVDQRQAGLAHTLRVHLDARAQVRNQGFEFSFRADTEGLRQLFLEIGIHLLHARKAQPRTHHSCYRCRQRRRLLRIGGQRDQA